MGDRDFEILLPIEVYQKVLQILEVAVFEEQMREARLILLQEILTRVDPEQRGMVLAIVSCTPPCTNALVSSLYTQMTVGTPPWHNESDQILFFGTEALATYVVMKGTGFLVSDTHAKDGRHLFVAPKGARSLACYPIKRFGRSAGVLVVASTFTLSETFSGFLQEVATVLGLTIPEQDLYAIQQIAFQMMPPLPIQRSLLEGYSQRLLRVVEHCRKQDQSLSFTQAKRLVLQQYERELLTLALTSPQLP